MSGTRENLDMKLDMIRKEVMASIPDREAELDLDLDSVSRSFPVEHYKIKKLHPLKKSQASAGETEPHWFPLLFIYLLLIPLPLLLIALALIHWGG